MEHPRTNDVELVRQRPGMFVGNRATSGLLQYLTYACQLGIHWGTSQFEISLYPKLSIQFQVPFPTARSIEACLESFTMTVGHISWPLTLNALAERLDVYQESHHRLAYRHGVRVAENLPFLPSQSISFHIEPDPDIFTEASLCPDMVHNFVNRIAYWHPQVVWQLRMEQETRQIQQADGILGFYRSMTTAYQWIHAPIHLSAKRGDLNIHLVFAFHSWTEDITWTFANYLRMESGTPEQELRSALDAYRTTLLPQNHGNTEGISGYLAMLFLHQPDIQFAGHHRKQIQQPTLGHQVRLLIDQLLQTHSPDPTMLKNLCQNSFGDFYCDPSQQRIRWEEPNG